MEQQILRRQLLDYLEGRHAHTPLRDALKNLPVAMVNRNIPNLPYSIWGILEHIRRAQNDILDFIQNPDYQEKSWPQDYWPPNNQKVSKKMWDNSLKDYNKDLHSLIKIVKAPKTDLLAHIPHGQGQTILREIMLIIDHTAYHTGEIVIMRRLLNQWGVRKK